MASEHDVMPEAVPGEDQSTVTSGTMELIVSGLFMLVAVVVMYDSARIGNGWSSDGPQSGYFPFYVALIMFFASAATFATNLFGAMNLFGRKSDDENFVGRSSLRLVLKVLVPTFVYVVVMYFLGIYVASALYIGFFMKWLGKYSTLKTVPVAIVIPLVLFWVFEIAFLIPLPKGPLEAALGF